MGIDDRDDDMQIDSMQIDSRQIDDVAADARLLLGLRALRQDVAPTRDLWPGIAARLAAAPARLAPVELPGEGSTAQPRARPARRRWFRQPVPLATAAALLLAIGVGWQGMQHGRSDAAPPLLVHAADGLAEQYAEALRQVDAARGMPAAQPGLVQPDLAQLDASAAQVRQALAHDPDARFLLARLQSLYARRLALTQRLAAMG